MDTIKTKRDSLLFGLISILIMIFIFSVYAKAETFDGKEISRYLSTIEKTKKRQPPLDPKTGLYVNQIKPHLFYVTDGVYQSAFLETAEGIIIFDSPPSFGNKLPAIIAQYAPDQKIKYLVYSHGHKDHIGGSALFKSIEGLEVIAQESVANSLAHRANPEILPPTISYTNYHTLSLGDDRIELINQGHFHSNDADSFVYLPKQKFLIAVDVLSPGYAPFKEFEVTPDFGRYLTIFELMAKTGAFLAVFQWFSK